MKQHCAETYGQIAYIKEMTEIGQQSHHRRMVIIAPSQKLPIQGIVRLVRMDIGEDGLDKIHTQPYQQEYIESFFFFFYTAKLHKFLESPYLLFNLHIKR